MVNHYNPSIVERAQRIFRTKAFDVMSSEIEPNIKAIIPISPVLNIVRFAVRSTTGTTQVYTTPSDKDFYLTALTLGGSSNATSDGTAMYIQVTIDGVTQRPLYLVKQTLTAFTGNVAIAFPFPIKLDRNTNVSLTLSFTVGNDSGVCTLAGYTEETAS